MFEEGDHGDLMYVILRGAVEISVKKKIGDVIKMEERRVGGGRRGKRI